MNGGLWCSPVAKTSRPTSSAFLAIATVLLMRSCSVGVRPVVGSVVTSPTVKMPSCMEAPEGLVVESATDPPNPAAEPSIPGPEGSPRCGRDHHVAQVGLTVPVLARDQHQPPGHPLAEQPLRVV